MTKTIPNNLKIPFKKIFPWIFLLFLIIAILIFLQLPKGAQQWLVSEIIDVETQQETVTPSQDSDVLLPPEWLFPGTAKIAEMLVDEEENLADAYDDLQEVWVNLVRLMYFQFQRIQSAEQFEDFLDEFSSDFLFSAIIKNNSRELWEKYWSYTYDYYVSIWDEYLANDMKNYIEGDENSKDAFLRLMNVKFIEFRNGLTTSLTEKDLGMDINVYFNSLPLEEALNNCVLIKDFKQEYSNIASCEDKIYFFRATSENKFCDKISTDYKKSICEDFLLFQQR